MTLLKRDMRPQNFIYQGAELWGIDFEEASYGEREWDVADFLSTLIEGTDPGDTQEVLRRIRFFLTTYENSRHLCRDTLMGCLSATLKRRIIFRKQSRPWLEKWIRRLEEPLELF
jgi:aminoglycoside phosphotransferase (APT) family kinase protein